MAQPTPSLGDLRRKSAVSDEAIDAAVKAYFEDPATGDFAIGAYTLDLAAAVLASKYATDTLAKPDATDPAKRNAVRTAILLASPTETTG